jgi:DNA repair exonuclease SbcCD ATPase subunit
VQEENVALSEDLAVMVKENQLVSGQLGQSAEQIDDLRQELHQLQSNNGVLTQTFKAREMELEDLRTAYEDLAAEDRQHQSSIGQLKRQLGGHSVELEAAKQEVMHLQEAQHSAQLQMQQYVVDIQALERNSDSLARELQSAKNEAEDISRDRNRVLEQLQAVQVRQHSTEMLWFHAELSVEVSIHASCGIDAESCTVLVMSQMSKQEEGKSTRNFVKVASTWRCDSVSLFVGMSHGIIIGDSGCENMRSCELCSPNATRPSP